MKIDEVLAILGLIWAFALMGYGIKKGWDWLFK